MVKPPKPDQVVAVVPQYCSGPGWANSIVWFFWVDDGGRIQRDCLQPEEQNDHVRFLFRVSATAHEQMLGAVKGALDVMHASKRKKRRKERTHV